MSKALNIFDDLVRQAKVRTMIGYPDELRMQHARERGEPLPDICKPGYLLTKLDPEERQSLAQLTSQECQNFGWIDLNRLHEDYVAYEKRRSQR